MRISGLRIAIKAQILVNHPDYYLYYLKLYIDIISNDTQIIHWIGLREKLQETIFFTIEYGGLRFQFCLKPIQ